VASVSCLRVTRHLRVFAASTRQEATTVCELVAALDLDGHGDRAVVAVAPRTTLALRPLAPVAAVVQTWQVLSVLDHQG